MWRRRRGAGGGVSVCGIAGRLNFLSGAPVEAATIRRMATLLAHRGPDGEAIHTRSNWMNRIRSMAVVNPHPLRPHAPAASAV